MECYKYYLPGGKEIDQEQFIEFYSKVYFFLNRNHKLEDEIEALISKDSLTEHELMEILKWKLGAPQYVDYTLKTRYHTIEACALVKKLSGPKPVNVCADDFLREIAGGQFKGIGPVYAITLLFFLSKGCYPIYDKYAHIALKVILDHMDYTGIVTDSDISREFHNSSHSKRYPHDYKAYIDKMKAVFGEKYIKDRRIDQALWTYGHLFNDTRTNHQK